MDGGNRVLMLGLGGGAGRILQVLAKRPDTEWLDYVYADTEVGELDYEGGVVMVPLGREWTDGLGTGGDMLLGQRAASANLEEIRELLRNAKLVIVLGCLGGGTASGALQVLAALAREEKKLCLFFVTLPFANEGNQPRRLAEQGLAALRRNHEFVVAVRNDLFFSRFPPSTNVRKAFSLANQFIADGLVGFGEMLRCKGVLPIDVARLRALLRERQAFCSFGVGRASGEQRSEAVIDDLFQSPLLGAGEEGLSADAAVAYLVGGADLSIGEMNGCLERLHERLQGIANVVVGANLKQAPSPELQLTLFSIRYQDAPAPTAEDRRQRARTLAARLDGQGQGDLFGDEVFSLGIFAQGTPTVYRNHHLDIPTFRRLGVRLDVGEKA